MDQINATVVLAAIAVRNLIETAIRHNRDMGTVSITTDTTGGSVRLVIENDGRDLTPSETARLIEPFDRGDQTRLTAPSIGLGLTLADTIARALGGNLTITARPSGGLLTDLDIPAPQGEAA